tara:strand:- start:12640 stop:12900 length:261 start_codon:yes stop_codon:yes gene_type:complete
MSDESDKKMVGCKYIADTTLRTIKGQGFFTISPTTIAAITYPDGYDGPATDVGAALTGVTLPKEVYYPIPMETLDLTSGSVIVYLK